MKKPTQPQTSIEPPKPATRFAWLHAILANTQDCALIVLLLAACTYLPGYATARMFWDENYHITSAERYIQGIAQFEAHPPLGKLLIAAGEVITGSNRHLDKHALVGTKYIKGDDLPKGFSFTGMRLFPSLFAVLGAVCFFGLLFALTRNRLTSLLFSSLYIFENAFIVHFRAAHLDSFQLCFSLSALWYFVHLWRGSFRLKPLHYAGLGGLVALAIMVKINSVLLLLLLPLLYWRDVESQKINWPARCKDFCLKTCTTTAAILAVMLLVFWISALCGRNMPDPNSSAGQDDMGKMSPAYKQFLLNHELLTPITVARIGIDYFGFMNQSHHGVPKLDICKPEENGSHPMTWLLMNKTINYRWDSGDGRTGYVQLVGNTVSWFLGLAAVILSLGLVVSHRIFKAPVRNEESYRLIEVFSLIYLAFMALHLWLGLQRVMYLYHYFFGLTISYVLLVLNVEYLSEVQAWLNKRRIAVLGGGALVIIISYAFIAPLSYHYPITKAQCEQRNWLFRTVNCVN